MYRIKLGSGEEAVFRSTEELTVAVRTGVVSPKSEVFHNAANRWLPIHVHPEYRAAAAEHTPELPEQSEPPVEPVSQIGQVALLEQSVEPPAPEEEAAERAGELPRTAELWVPRVESESAAIFGDGPAHPGDFETGSAPRRASRARQLRTILALAMGLAGLGLVGGGGYAFWRYALPLLEQRHPSLQLSEGMAPAPAGPLSVKRLDSFPTSYPAPAPPLPPQSAVRAAPQATAPSPPALQLPPTRNSTGYYAAYAGARAEMDDALNYISFQRVFEPDRFASPEHIRATRRMVSAAGNILRVYRGKEVMLEQTYRPDDLDGRGSLRESFEASEAARSLLADVDSLLGILVAQEGRITWTEGSVSFDDPEAAEAYFTLRRSVSFEILTWRDSAEAQNRVTMPRLLRAFDGAWFPPIRQ